MFVGISSVEYTMIGVTRLGRSSRKRMYLGRAPRLRAASTNSRSRSESVWSRMILLIYGQLKNLIIKISKAIRSVLLERLNVVDGIMLASVIVKISSGKARNT